MKKVTIKIKFNEIKRIINSKLEFRMIMDLWETKYIKMIDFISNKECSYDRFTDYRIVVFNYKNTGKLKVSKLHFIQGVKYHKKEILNFLEALRDLKAEVKKETFNPQELENGDLIVSEDYSNWRAGKCFNGGNYGFSADGYIGGNWHFSTTHDWGCCPDCGRDLFNDSDYEHECEPKKVSINNIPYDDVKFYKITNYKIVIEDLDEVIADFKQNGEKKLYKAGVKYLKDNYPELENEIKIKL